MISIFLGLDQSMQLWVGLILRIFGEGQVKKHPVFDRLWRGGKRKRDEPTGEDEVEGRRGAKQTRNSMEVDMSKYSMDTSKSMESEVEMSDMEAVVNQSTLYDELYRAYMLLREPLD